MPNDPDPDRDRDLDQSLIVLENNFGGPIINQPNFSCSLSHKTSSRGFATAEVITATLAAAFP